MACPILNCCNDITIAITSIFNEKTIVCLSLIHILYNGAPKDMIYSVIAGDQVKLVTRQVREIDPQAFINILKTDQVAGNFYQRPND